MRWHGTEVVCHTGLTFAGEDEKFYFFKLPFGRPANEFLEGTSGAPICDNERNVAAFVCGPGGEPDTIGGIKVQFFRSALESKLLELARTTADKIGNQ